MPDTHSAMTTPAPNEGRAGLIAGYEPRTSDTQASLFVALMNLQAELDPIKKGSENEHLRSTYADLTALWAAIRRA